MYKIIKDNQVIATLEKITYIKKHPNNNCYIPAEESDAEGISIASLQAPYALMGKELNDLEQVVIVECDGGADIESITGTLDIDINARKSEKEKAIEQTHKWLRRELRRGMKYKDGKTYTVTLEKQQLLMSRLIIGNALKDRGIPENEIYLSWSAAGEKHGSWLFEDLGELSFTINSYVEPMVEKQQEGEININEAETSEEINEILADFI